jgi:hypothetical protein
MAGPTPGQVEQYVRMFEQLSDTPSSIGESLCWAVLRPQQGRLTVDEVVRRLHGDPDAMTSQRPADLGYDYDTVFVEQRDDAVIIVGYSDASAEQDVLRRLSQCVTVHGVFWLINNFSRLHYVVDGVLVTELDVLDPWDRSGTDPEALNDHLDALRDRHDRSMSGTGPGAFLDWPTAMATMESLTGLRLDADWFQRPQLSARVNSR